MRDKSIPLTEIQNWLQHGPIFTVNLVIINGGKVLLLKRRNEPAKGQWFTPGGIITKKGSLSRQMFEIAEEETGLVIAFGETPITVSDEWWDEGYGTTDIHLITAVYECRVVEGRIQTDDQHDDIQWFPIDALPEGTNCNVRHWIRMTT